jgi:hypothetical protein
MMVPVALIARKYMSEMSKVSDLRAGETRDQKLKSSRCDAVRHVNIRPPMGTCQPHYENEIEAKVPLLAPLRPNDKRSNEWLERE